MEGNLCVRQSFRKSLHSEIFLRLKSEFFNFQTSETFFPLLKFFSLDSELLLKISEVRNSESPIFWNFRLSGLLAPLWLNPSGTSEVWMSENPNFRFLGFRFSEFSESFLGFSLEIFWSSNVWKPKFSNFQVSNFFHRQFVFLPINQHKGHIDDLYSPHWESYLELLQWE